MLYSTKATLLRRRSSRTEWPRLNGCLNRRRGPADVSSSDTAGAAPISAGPRIPTAGARPARDGTSATSRNVTEPRTPLLSALPFELLPERGYPRARHNCQLGSNPNASLWNSTQRRDTTSSASRASTSSDSLSLPRATDDDACQPVGARAEDRCLLEAAVEHQFACSEYRRGNQLARTS